VGPLSPFQYPPQFAVSCAIIVVVVVDHLFGCRHPPRNSLRAALTWTRLGRLRGPFIQCTPSSFRGGSLYRHLGVPINWCNPFSFLGVPINWCNPFSSLGVPITRRIVSESAVVRCRRGWRDAICRWIGRKDIVEMGWGCLGVLLF
jgi:hypothetical protein